MEMLGQNNILFKDIFPNYEIFSNWWIGTGLADYDGVNYSVPERITFTLIANQYNCSHVAYSLEGFYQHFANDIYTYYKEFEETTKTINELMSLTDDEISIADQMVINMAVVPEETSSTDVETVDYISQQQKTISKKGKLQVKKEQLSNKRSYTVKTFLKRFKHLFINILSPAYNFVVAEPEGE